MASIWIHDELAREVHRMMDPPTVEQKSAVVLSVWHCILAEFFANAKDEHLDDKFIRKKMEKLYKNMKTIRLAIHGAHDQEEDHRANDHEEEEEREELGYLASHVITPITKYNRLVEYSEGWSTDLAFLMQELGDMEAYLKQHSNDIRNNVDEVPDQQQVRHLVCLITLWYWVAAWSVLTNDRSYTARETFFHSVETKAPRSLAPLLFSVNNADSYNEEKGDLKSMLDSLLKMLGASPDHWIDVLQHFTHNLLETACTVGIITEEIKDTYFKTDTEGVNSNANEHQAKRQRQRRRQPKRAHKLMREEQESRGHCKPLFNELIKQSPVAHPVESFKNVIVNVWHDVGKIGQHAAGTISGVVQTIEQGEHVIEDVKHLAHTIGHGLASFFHRTF